MVKAKTITKGQLLITCSNGVTAIFMTHFKSIKVFYEGRHVNTISSEDVTLSELDKLLESYSNVLPSKGFDYGKE